MLAIKKFINELDINKKYTDVVGEFYDKRISNKRDVTNLFIYSTDYMLDVLIPFLNQLD